MTAWIKAVVDSEHVLAAFRRLSDLAASPHAVYADWGDALLISTRKRVDDQLSPDGTPFKPLNLRYAADRLKKYGQRPILNREFHMTGDRFRYDPDGPELVIGTSARQGPTHQFGRPGKNIPARPWLGLSDADQAELRRILTDHLRDAAHF